MPDEELLQIYEVYKQHGISDSEALEKALPLLRGKVSDKQLIWMAQEKEGYGALAGESKVSPVSPDRSVYGELRAIIDEKVLKVNWGPANDRLVGLMHPLSKIEEELSDGSDHLVLNLDIGVDVSELEKSGPLVLCCHRSQLERILARFRKEFILILERELGII